MKFRGIGVIIVWVSLLVLSVVTGGILFFVSVALLSLVIGFDFYRLSRYMSELGLVQVDRYLTLKNICPGSTTELVTRVKYGGKSSLRVNYHQPTVDGLAMSAPSPCNLVLKPNSVEELSHTLKPLKTGDYVVPSLVLSVESWFFRDSASSCEPVALASYVGISTPGDKSQNVSNIDKKYWDLIIKKAERTMAGTDFSTVRKYQPGDNIRNVDWARSSRSGHLTIREFDREENYPAFFLIDVDVSMGTGAPSELQSATSLATKLINRLSLENTMFGIIGFSRDHVVKYLPLGIGRNQSLKARDLLSSLEPVEAKRDFIRHNVSFSSAETLRLLLCETKALGGVGEVLEATINDYWVNLDQGGLSDAVLKIAQMIGSPCQLIIVTNVSMGLENLMNNIRTALYYGHHVTVVLTPHLWYGENDPGSPETSYIMYRSVKDTLRRLNSTGVKVLDMCALDHQERGYLWDSRVPLGNEVI